MMARPLLNHIRDQYLSQFRQRIADAKRAGMRVITEAAYLDKDGNLVCEGILKLPLRLDIATVADGGAKDIIRVDSDSVVASQPIDFVSASGVLIRLAPFHWDDCHVRAHGIDEMTDWHHIQRWFNNWFDREDARQPDADGFVGVIHFLSDPKHNGSLVNFEVDFGSAPVAAFEEFLDALQDSGARKIEIGSIHGA